jgi:hypothetical protein
MHAFGECPLGGQELRYQFVHRAVLPLDGVSR